ncbi:LOW QUALITY PROTEIN: LOB domain-containing protein 6 isoform X1 [Populus alba x Populus x berolinensis]|nr:LOW QUALITY PROTEIN: LOB domain-containing protein 6 isoform X1 [Populus alba x Populus x berolinensis]
MSKQHNMLQISERSLSRAGREIGNRNNTKTDKHSPPHSQSLTHSPPLSLSLSLSTFLPLSPIDSLIACFCFLSVSLASASGGTFPFSLADITSHTPLSLSTLYPSTHTHTHTLSPFLPLLPRPLYLSRAYVLIVIIFICILSVPAKKLRTDKDPRREEKRVIRRGGILLSFFQLSTSKEEEEEEENTQNLGVKLSFEGSFLFPLFSSPFFDRERSSPSSTNNGRKGLKKERKRRRWKMASSSNSPCAACKFLRRKCQTECVFAPYFPPDQPQKFSNVHKVFGASNVTKLLNELHPSQREDAVNSLAYEADMRLRDPVYGCVGVISLLQHQLRQLQIDLSCAKSELSKYQNLGITGHAGSLIAAAAAAATATATTHHHHHPQNLGINLIGAGGGSRDHHYHHQFFPKDQQQMMRSFDAGNNYDASLLAMNVSAKPLVGMTAAPLTPLRVSLPQGSTSKGFTLD